MAEPLRGRESAGAMVAAYSGRRGGRQVRGTVIGMPPIGHAAAEALYRVIDAAYERRSVIVTSNLHPSGFDSIMPKTLATSGQGVVPPDRPG